MNIFYGEKAIVNFLTFTKLVMIIAFLSHFISCLFNRIADIEDYTVYVLFRKAGKATMEF